MPRREVKSVVEKTCPFCGVKNPPSAYACLQCYKVMKRNYKIPFWKVQINHTISILFLLTVGLAGGLWFIKRWGEAIEAEMTIRIKTDEYQFSLSAGKLRERDVESDDKAPVPSTQ